MRRSDAPGVRLIGASALAGLIFAAGAAWSADLIVQWRDRPPVAGAPGRATMLPASLRHLGLTTGAPLFPGHADPADPLGRFWRLAVDAGVPAGEVAGRLAARTDVAAVEEDRVVPLAGCLPDDPYLTHVHPDSAQWSLFANPAGPDVGAIEAWNVTPGDPDVIVAVLDSGVDWHHPDFGPPLSPDGQIWMNAVEAAGLPGVDDDANGFVDDLRGWDFVDVSTILGESERVDPGEDGLTSDNDPVDYDGHGTFVSGIVGAAMNNRQGMAGLAPGCRVMPMRVGWRENYMNPNTGATVIQGVVSMAFCAQAIVYAADNGARVLNCSWLSDETVPLRQALDYAIQVKRVTVVDAAGNGGLTTGQNRNYLSRRGDCIEVAALARTGEISGVSSIGEWVDIAAPGENLLSLVAGTGPRDYKIYQAGATSFAAPFVSAAAGLLLSIEPELTPAEVRTRLMETATSIDTIGVNPFFVGRYGAGMVNAAGLFADRGLPPQPITQPLVGDPLVIVTGDQSLYFAGGPPGRLTSWFPGLGQPWQIRLPREEPLAGIAATGGLLDGWVAIAQTPGLVTLIDVSGQALPGWPRPVAGRLWNSPILVELSGGDADPEIVVAGSDSLLYAWNRLGIPPAGFPVRLPDAVPGPLASADIDGDGALEIVVLTADEQIVVVEPDGTTHAWPSAAGTGLPGASRNGALIVSFDADDRPDLVVWSGGDLRIIPGASGASAWQVPAGSPIVGEPAPGPIDSWPGFDLVLVRADRTVSVRGVNDAAPRAVTELEDVPTAGALLSQSLDGSEQTIFVPTGDGCIGAFHPDGTPSTQGGRFLLTGATGRMVLGGSDAIGTAGMPWTLVAETDGPGLAGFRSRPGLGQVVTWPMVGGTAQRPRARVLPPGGVLQEVPAAHSPAFGFRAVPNPAARGEAIRFVSGTESAPVFPIDIFDLAGRRVRRLKDGTATWRGEDDRGEPLPVGLYFARVDAPAGSSHVARVLLLR